MLGEPQIVGKAIWPEGAPGDVAMFSGDRLRDQLPPRAFVSVDLKGVWDLPMIGDERLEVEQRYLALSSAPRLRITDLAGIFLNRLDGTCCHLYMEDRDAKRVPHRAGALLDAAVLVVRTAALDDLKARVKVWSSPDGGKPARTSSSTDKSEPSAMDKPLLERERLSLLRIIRALAKEARFLTQMCARFSPSRSAAPWEEAADVLVPANQR